MKSKKIPFQGTSPEGRLHAEPEGSRRRKISQMIGVPVVRDFLLQSLAHQSPLLKVDVKGDANQNQLLKGDAS